MMDLQASSAPQAPQPNNESNRKQRAFITEVGDDNNFGSNFSPAIIYALIVLLVVVLEAFLIFMLVSTNGSKIKTLNSKITQSNTQLNEEPLKTVNAQVAQINKGLKVYDQYKVSNVDYSSLWTALQSYTAPNVQLKALSVNNKGVLKIDAQATNFSDIAKEITALKSANSISNVALITTNSDNQSKSFSLTARYVPIKTNQGGK